MKKRLALFLFSVGLGASAMAAHMDELACREYCAIERATCEANDEGLCWQKERNCYMECMHY